MVECDCASPECKECNVRTIQRMGPRLATQYSRLWQWIDHSALLETDESPRVARARTASDKQWRAKQLSRSAQRPQTPPPTKYPALRPLKTRTTLDSLVAA
jgi:hypothetical protein